MEEDNKAAVVGTEDRVEGTSTKYSRTSNRTEFMVGAAVTGFLGGAFILTAFVLLGVYYMDGLLRGMSLYGLAAILLMVSEFLVWRRWKGLACVLTSIGLGGIYVSTLVNCRAMGNFPWMAGLVLVALATFFSLFLCWVRGVETYRIVGLLFCYGCYGFWSLQVNSVQFLVLGLLLLGVNLAGTLVPVRRHGLAVTVVHMVGCMLASRLFLWHGGDWNGIAMGPQVVYIMGVVVVLHLLLYRQLKAEATGGAKSHGSAAVPVLVTAYVFSLYLLRGLILYGKDGHLVTVPMGRYQGEDPVAVGLALAGLLAVGLSCFFLLRRTWEKWILYYFGNLMILEIAMALGEHHEAVWCMLGLLVVAKALSWSGSRYLKGSEAVLTGAAALAVFVVPDHIASWLILAVLLGSLALVRYWHAYYEILVTYTLAAFAVFRLTSFPGLRLVVFTGILFLGLLLVSHVKRLRGRYPLVYQICNLAGMAGCYLMLLLPVYRQLSIVWLCMLVFGLCTMALALGDLPGLTLGRRLLVAELFAVYMVLVMGVRPVVGSVLLMVIALSGVAGGFLLGLKSIRICGLVLSVLVCCKIVLYDLKGGEPLQRILLFLSVGILALVIAGIYIILESRLPGGKKREDQSCGDSEVDRV